MKIKGEEYLRLHKIMTNISTTAVWEMLSEGRDVLEIIKDVPDEFYNKVKSYVRDLKYTYLSLSEYAGKTHDGFRYGKFGDRDPEPSKKEFAEFVMKQDKILSPILFSMWDNNNEKVDEIIWKLVKPQYSKPFWQKELEP